jgi:hypothetical protein
MTFGDVFSETNLDSSIIDVILLTNLIFLASYYIDDALTTYPEIDGTFPLFIIFKLDFGSRDCSFKLDGLLTRFVK